jgi:hypothetical protein
MSACMHDAPRFAWEAQSQLAKEAAPYEECHRCAKIRGVAVLGWAEGTGADMDQLILKRASASRPLASGATTITTSSPTARWSAKTAKSPIGTP